MPDNDKDRWKTLTEEVEVAGNNLVEEVKRLTDGMAFHRGRAKTHDWRGASLSKGGRPWAGIRGSL